MFGVIGGAGCLALRSMSAMREIRGSGKLPDHITQRFGFDQEQDDSGQEYYVLNGISSHKLISPLLLPRLPRLLFVRSYSLLCKVGLFE